MASYVIWIITLSCLCDTFLSVDIWRSINGQENNPDHPEWGTPNRPQRRIQHKLVDDHVSPSSLPSARLISNILFSPPHEYANRKPDVNDLHTWWAFFIGNDMLGQPEPEGTESFDIPVPPKDPWFNSMPLENKTLPFKRLPAIDGTGKDARHTILNTAWLDLSQVYGLSDTAHLLRTNTNGKLRLDYFYKGRNVVPDQGQWRVSGDDRMNLEMNISPQIAIINTIFRKEHNRLCDELLKKHSKWDDEDLYQEARRLLIGIYQKITTREYLATLTGEPLPPYTGYNKTIDPQPSYIFGKAAMRYGHSEINNVVKSINGDFIIEKEILMSECIFRPWLYLDIKNTNSNSFENILRGSLTQRKGKNSLRYPDSMRNIHAFGRFLTNNAANDLAAMDIQRGRDLELPSYNTVREFYNLPKHKDFSTISSNVKIVEGLKSSYESVDDIDLLVGGLAEDHCCGGFVGPLFRAIIREQFRRVRDGDRFWFENRGQGDKSDNRTYWTEEEITMALERKLADIIHNNTEIDNGFQIHRNAFFITPQEIIPANEDLIEFEINSIGYGNVKTLHRSIKLFWTIKKKVISFLVVTTITGYIGIGFDPEPSSMKGADIILLRAPKNGKPDIWDCYAQDVGIPVKDTKIGGVDSLRKRHFENIDGVSYFSFERDLDTGDKKDKPFKKHLRNELIFAFHQEREFVYHGPNKGTLSDMNFVTNLDMEVIKHFFIIITSVCIFATVIGMMLVVKFREKKNNESC